MEESDKLPLKRVELSLSKFNEVAIPHHLDLLRQHKANIIRYSESGSYLRVRSEQVAARRVCEQLRALLQELAALRARVRAADLPAFDATTRHHTDLTLIAITDYLGLIESGCRAIVASSSPQPIETSLLRRSAAERGVEVSGSALSSDSVGVLPLPEGDEPSHLIQLHIDEQELSLKQREDVLAGWSALQEEVHALHATWAHLHHATDAQRTQVECTDTRVEETAENVQAARAHLSYAERLRGSSVALGGACVGLLAGGPAGLVLGAKAGAAAALAGSLLGYLGGRAAAARALPPCAPAPLTAPRDDKCKED